MSSTLKRTLLYGFCFALALAFGLVLSLAGTFLYLNPQTPAAETYRNVRLETPLRIYTADGGLIAEFGERRVIPVAIEDVPRDFINALLDTEDKRFYEHGGIDYLSLANDTLALILSRDVSSGGASTITMQLARNISFSLEQTFIRKFKEMLLALKLERELTKDEILELYINAVPFGKRAYGAQAAAYTYYNQPLGELRLAQLAMLAGIPQAPSAGNPINGPERATKRRNLVLSRMLEQASITRAQFDAASAEPITAQVYQRQLEVPAPFAAEWIRSQLLGRLPDLYSAGYVIHTTLRDEAQLAATGTLRDGLMSYDVKHGYRGPEARLSPEDYARALRSAPVYADLQPAVVTEVDADGATVLLDDGSSVRVGFDTMAWARRYLNVNERGPAPKSTADVVATGDLIRVRQLPLDPDERTAAAAADDALEDPAADDAGAFRWHFAQVPEAQGALISMDADTGAVEAIEGGFDFSRNQFNHALQATRQPGSGFKPFVYSAALNGEVTAATVYMDAPLVFEDEELETEYRPGNDSRRYNGPTRLREALYRSINLVSMRLILDIGAGNVIRHAERFGFPIETFPRDTQLALGGGTMAITPLQMAQAYGVLANGGYEVEPYIITRVEDLSGQIIEQASPLIVCRDCADDEPGAAGESPDDGSDGALTAATEDGGPVEGAATDAEPDTTIEPRYAQRVLDARNAFIMNTMLKDVVRRGTGRRARVLERTDLAGKTGTTNDGTDTWFNGYAGGLVTTVWVGFSDNEPLGARAYGGNTALPIWVDYMRTALDGRPIYAPSQPPGITVVKIDPDTGEPARPGQADAIFEYFFAENAPVLASDGNRPATPEEDNDLRAVDLF
ncbi:MAG: PBP1A family penicillin-binding protein [Pseudomonadota bacterium]